LIHDFHNQNPAVGCGGILVVKAVAAFDVQVDNKSRVRLQHLAKRLHALGPKPLFHFLDELERSADLHDLLEEYAALPADFVRAYGGDKFEPSLFAIKGGRDG
jgi:hypothetical protein